MTGTDFDQFLLTFPSAARTLLATLQRDFAGVICRTDAEQLAEVCQLDTEGLLVALVPWARHYARVPVSGFAVGAVARGAATGNLYFGANLEFTGVVLQLTVHAEQATINNAWLHGETGLTAIAVSAAPCGQCRQFMNELQSADGLHVMVRKPDDLTTFKSALTALLPQAFGPRDLNVPSGLMSLQQHGLQLETPGPDPLVAAALAAANASYAPYTSAYAGVALQTRGGAVYAGRYAENAAFNPTLNVMGSALAAWMLSTTGALDEIVDAACVEHRPGLAQARTAELVLASVSRAGLRSYFAVQPTSIR